VRPRSDCRLLVTKRRPRSSYWSLLRRRCPSESSLVWLGSLWQVAHAVALLKSHTPNLDTEHLRRDFPFDNDE
jgi:hypothetical protein